MNLRLLQLGDSALPIGGYSQSFGLEAAVHEGLVHDAEGLESWVRRWLRFVVGPFEGVIVAGVCRALAQHDYAAATLANDWLWAGLSAPTLRQASRDMGEQLLALAESWTWAAVSTGQLRRLQQEHGRPWHHAPVFAALAWAAGSEPGDALLVYLHQAALGMIGAGVRVIPIGHTHGQQLLARLHDDLHALAADMSTRPLECAGSNSPAYEVFCDAQSRLYTRLFRS